MKNIVISERFLFQTVKKLAIFFALFFISLLFLSASANAYDLTPYTDFLLMGTAVIEILFTAFLSSTLLFFTMGFIRKILYHVFNPQKHED